MKKCQGCENTLNENTQFCPKCGFKVNDYDELDNEHDEVELYDDLHTDILDINEINKVNIAEEDNTNFKPKEAFAFKQSFRKKFLNEDQKVKIKKIFAVSIGILLFLVISFFSSSEALLKSPSFKIFKAFLELSALSFDATEIDWLIVALTTTWSYSFAF